MALLHAVPVLFGCSISLTGAGPDERRKFERLIQVHGGTFVPDLHAQCTHLIVAEGALDISNRPSPKIIYARKWDIPLVKPAWLHECVHRRICLDPTPFLLVDPSDRDSLSLCSAYSQPYAEISAEELSNLDSMPQYLEGAHIYVGDQLATEHLALLKKLILAAGGTRHSDLFDRTIITHYIVHNQVLTPKDLNQLKLFGEALPLVVHDQWLFACFYSRERLPTDKFLINVPSVVARVASSQETVKEHFKPDPPSNAKACWSLKMSSHNGQDLASAVDETQPVKLPVFAGLKFGLYGWGDASIKMAQLTDLIEKNGGSLESEEGKDQLNLVDYTVARMIIQTTPSHNKLVVNELWLETCTQQGQLLETSSDTFFAPLVSQGLESSRFSEMKVSVTGIAGLEREYYSRLIQSLSATYTDNLTRQNTHLLAAVPSGPKYEFAQSVGIKCVSPRWLLDSISAGHPLETADFPVGSFSHDKENNQPCLNVPLSIAPPVEKRTLEAISVETPIRENISKRLKEVAAVIPTGLTQEMPCSPAEAPQESIPLDLLGGSTFSISQRLWHRRDEIHDLVTELGGIFVWSYDRTCTHYIHQGNVAEESFREFKLVRQQGKWIVSPWWLIRCKEARQRLSEMRYPHTFVPGSEENVVKTDAPPLSQIVSPFPSPQDSLSPPAIDFDSVIEADHRMDAKKRNPLIRVDYSARPDREILNKEPVAAEPIGQRIFSISGLTPDQRVSFPSALEDLGAQVLRSTNTWDNTSTHLIIGSLTKSEKFLAACAAGIWLLRPSYVTACINANSLDHEVDHEWHPGWCDEALAKAPRHWRDQRRRGVRAFAGWKVLLVADQKRLASLKNILLAGTAQVWTLADEASAVEEVEFTHLLVSSAQMKAKIPAGILDQCRERVHNVELIAEHLINSIKS